MTAANYLLLSVILGAGIGVKGDKGRAYLSQQFWGWMGVPLSPDPACTVSSQSSMTDTATVTVGRLSIALDIRTRQGMRDGGCGIVHETSVQAVAKGHIELEWTLGRIFKIPFCGNCPGGERRIFAIPYVCLGRREFRGSGSCS